VTVTSPLEPSLTHAGGLAALAAVNLAALGAEVAVYLDKVPADDEPNPDAVGGYGPAYPYVLFWSTPAGPYAPAERLKGWGGEVTSTTLATVAGLSEADVLGVDDRLTFALHRRKPQLAGRVPGDIEQDGAPGRPQPDPVRTPDGQLVFTTALFFTLHSSPKRTEGA
jgi:hypothetical protein